MRNGKHKCHYVNKQTIKENNKGNVMQNNHIKIVREMGSGNVTI